MKKILVAFGTLLASLILVSQCHAQINATFKSARSFNADSTTVRNEVNTLVSNYDSVGALYYNTQSSPAKWRVFESGTWKDLTSSTGGFANPMTTLGDIITGGALGVPTRLGIGTNSQSLQSDGTNISWSNNIGSVTNGLNATLGVARLGGTLTGNTSINAVNSYTFDFDNILTRLRVSGLVASFQGVQYLADYSANYTSRSLPDKGYVDGRTTLTNTFVGYGNGSNILTGESNFTYASGSDNLSINNGTNNIQISPTILQQNTATASNVIQVAGQTASGPYTITSTGGLVALNPGTGIIQLGSPGVAGNKTLQVSSSTANADLTILPQGTGDIIMTSNSQTLRLDGNAAEYGADYRATYNNRSLVDKGYLVDAIGSLQVKVVNIGDWDMNISVGGTATVNVAHGLVDYKQIRAIEVVIRDDSDATYYDLDQYAFATGTMSGGVAGFDTTNITLATTTGGTFDNLAFDSLTYNRGFVTIWYINAF